VNIQEYISSGIVESYVLGLASEAERKEFEERCDQYPELLQTRIAFEKALENQAMENAIAPSTFIKDKIFAEINQAPALIQAPVRQMSWLKYAVAASVILLLASVWMNITLYQKNNSLKNYTANSSLGSYGIYFLGVPH